VKRRVGVQWSRGVLGHKEPVAAVGDDDAVGEQLRVGLQQGQSQPAVQHVRLRVPHPAQVSHDARRVHAPRRHLEPAERGAPVRVYMLVSQLPAECFTAVPGVPSAFIYTLQCSESGCCRKFSEHVVGSLMTKSCVIAVNRVSNSLESPRNPGNLMELLLLVEIYWKFTKSSRNCLAVFDRLLLMYPTVRIGVILVLATHHMLL